MAALLAWHVGMHGQFANLSCISGVTIIELEIWDFFFIFIFLSFAQYLYDIL